MCEHERRADLGGTEDKNKVEAGGRSVKDVQRRRKEQRGKDTKECEQKGKEHSISFSPGPVIAFPTLIKRKISNRESVSGAR